VAADWHEPNDTAVHYAAIHLLHILFPDLANPAFFMKSGRPDNKTFWDCWKQEFYSPDAPPDAQHT